jgi:AraC-like DNA-binding protein
MALRLSLLRRLLAAEHMAAIEAAARNHLLPASPMAVGRLGQWLDGILARTHQSPEMLRHPAAVDALERELVMGLMGQVHLSDRREEPAPRAFRQRGFDRAIDCIRYADLTIPDNASLCAAAGVSRRTLEYAFFENLGLPPMTFIRQLRLHALRRTLLASSLGESTVTEVAYHLGFTQLGRLACDYRCAFGESPSVTLARCYRGDAPLIWPGPTPAMAVPLRRI